MSSGGRAPDSESRTRPDSATSGGVEADVPVGHRHAARAGERAAIRVRSIAPRTDEPIRMSGCSRVRRVSSTTFARQSSGTAAAWRDHDRLLVARGLVAHGDPAGAVVDGGRDARGADGVERVHRRDEPEPGRGRDPAEPRDVQLALRHHGDEHVERLLGDPVELLDVEQPAAAQRGDQRPVDEDLLDVAVGQHPRGVEVPDQPRGGQLGVALDEQERDVPGGRDRAQERASCRCPAAPPARRGRRSRALPAAARPRAHGRSRRRAAPD